MSRVVIELNSKQTKGSEINELKRNKTSAFGFCPVLCTVSCVLSVAASRVCSGCVSVYEWCGLFLFQYQSDQPRPRIALSSGPLSRGKQKADEQNKKNKKFEDISLQHPRLTTKYPRYAKTKGKRITKNKTKANKKTMRTKNKQKQTNKPQMHSSHFGVD
jgi:hypothetical protein